MTNKSIGSFLAELRKEKGLTQKEVADYLNVSDKTVSHWECDKYSPDISVIPVLAEFFGVTCDEILKGERKVPADNENKFSSEPPDKQSEYEKYAEIRLQNAYNKLRLTDIIAVFSAVLLWAALYIITELIEHHIGLWNFELYAKIGTAVASAISGAIIVLSSHLKFISMLNMSPLDKNAQAYWSKRAQRFHIMPLIIFLIMCIIAVTVFMPLSEAPIQSATATMPYYDEDLPPSVDASENYGYADKTEYISGEVFVSSD